MMYFVGVLYTSTEQILIGIIMNRLSYLFTGLVGTLCLFLMTDVTNAQVQTISEETNVVLGLEKSKDFYVIVKNNGFAPVSFYVHRTLNDIPEPPQDSDRSSWYSAICMEDVCYDPKVDSTSSETILADSTYRVKFTVHTGDVAETQGRFVLKFIMDGFVEREFDSIEFNVRATDGPNSVPVIVDAAHLPYPNPALANVAIPLTVVENPQHVELFSITGTLLKTFDGRELSAEELRIETADLAPGAYYYTIAGVKESRVGRFQVVR